MKRIVANFALWFLGGALLFGLAFSRYGTQWPSSALIFVLAWLMLGALQWWRWRAQ
jgi:uncharacterized membrane protein YdbT with pleckstrin-like domain